LLDALRGAQVVFVYVVLFSLGDQMRILFLVFLVVVNVPVCRSASDILPGETSSSNGPPVSAFVFQDLSPKLWRETVAKWEAQVKTATSNRTGGAGGNITGIAQSFVPHCDRICAVEACAYAVSRKEGWLRFDIHEDDADQPSSKVLCRTWLRVDPGCPVRYGYMVFDVPDIEVIATQRYWFTLVEYSESGTLVNIGYSHGNQYDEGRVLGPESSMSSDFDVKFSIIEECPPFPGLRKLTGDELARVPSPIWANGDWREMPPRATREQRESAWSSRVEGLMGRLVLRKEPLHGDYGFGIGLEMYNDSGCDLYVPMWNPECVQISVWSADGKLVPPELESGRFMSRNEAPVVLPAGGYISYSIPHYWRPTKHNGRGNFEWNGRHWDLPGGIYELRAEYKSLFARSPVPERSCLWYGRLILPPMRIVVRADGSAESAAPVQGPSQ
jgi:hypothetical protein